MHDQLTIFTERLCPGRPEKNDLTLPPEFLGLGEEDIRFSSPLTLQGEMCRMDDLILITLAAQMTIEMPCSICNTLTTLPLQNKNILLSIPLSDVPAGSFNYTDLLREEVIMSLPQFIECHEGACPKRKEVQSFLKSAEKQAPTYFPFAEL